MPLRNGRYKGPHLATRRLILELLKVDGEQSSRELAGKLGISAMAARQHLQDLEEGGEVRCRDESRGVGRPTKLWILTQSGHRRFPDRHRELIVDLLDRMRDRFGEEGVATLLEARGHGQAESYRRRMGKEASLGKRVAALAQARSEEGYMAESRREKEGTFLLIENHCPICEAASNCRSLCATELAVFQEALGEGCRVERVEHILAGDRRCAYRISAVR